MKGGSNDLSVPLSVALSVLNNELKTISPSSISTEDKTMKVEDLDNKVDELGSVFNEIQPFLDNEDFSNIATVREKIKETITNTNKSIENIKEFSNTYKLGEDILREVVDISGIKVNE